MNSFDRRLLMPLTSLRLTVVLLALAMVLVFFGTLEQVHIGIYGAQKKYFDSFFVFWGPENSTRKIPVLPGGYLVGGLLLINLLAAHAVRFKFTWKKSGIFLLHIGIIMLLVGQLLTSLLARESQMRIDEGGSKNYAESFLEKELVIIDRSGPKTDRVTSIPEALLREGKPISLPDLGMRLEIGRYFPNATAVMKSQLPSPTVPFLEIGPQAVLVPIPLAANPEQTNTPAMQLRVIDAKASASPVELILAERIPTPRSITVGGKNYEVALRARRYYKPYTVALLDFTHKVYPGTDIPKDFSSKVVVTDHATGNRREALIYMNHPLRHDGATFYQLSFANNDTTSILQVVRNPSWLLPYIACTLVGLGLTIQFGIHLFQFAGRRRT